MTESGTDLRRALAAFAARPRVLVAVDFDGTLSPFVLDPMQARAVPGGLEALRAAAALGGVIAAIVSRRDLATPAAKSASNRQPPHLCKLVLCQR